MQSFERSLERMVEGVFGRGSRSSLRPVELGRRLHREMDDHRSVDVKGQRIVPNDFTFYLAARDHSAFADIEDALCAELAEAAREYAREEQYHLMGPIAITLEVDNQLRPGRFEVVSRMKESATGGGVGSLILPSGERVALNKPTVTIGRLPDCDLTVSDPNVSRRHSTVRAVGTGYVVSDLGSTNGTKVNGVRIDGDRMLNDGDIVSVGGTHLRFEAQ